MICSISRGTVLAVLAGFAGAATAASTSPVSLTDAAENASLIEIRHPLARAPCCVHPVAYFANEEMSVSWDDQQVLVLCKEAAYLQIPLPSSKPLR